ncbi:hypothetical protein HK098_006622, partial [Nowakowskiella sp. JEL0407]
MSATYLRKIRITTKDQSKIKILMQFLKKKFESEYKIIKGGIILTADPSSSDSSDVELMLGAMDNFQKSLKPTNEESSSFSANTSMTPPHSHPTDLEQNSFEDSPKVTPSSESIQPVVMIFKNADSTISTEKTCQVQITTNSKISTENISVVQKTEEIENSVISSSSNTGNETNLALTAHQAKETTRSTFAGKKSKGNQKALLKEFDKGKRPVRYNDDKTEAEEEQKTEVPKEREREALVVAEVCQGSSSSASAYETKDFGDRKGKGKMVCESFDQ